MASNDNLPLSINNCMMDIDCIKDDLSKAKSVPLESSLNFEPCLLIARISYANIQEKLDIVKESLSILFFSFQTKIEPDEDSNFLPIKNESIDDGFGEEPDHPSLYSQDDLTSSKPQTFWFSCKFCLEENLTLSYDSKSKLMEHIKEQHRETIKIHCKYCEDNFKSKASLKEHLISIHYEVIKINCQYCSESCISKLQMDKHLAQHHSDKINSNEGDPSNIKSENVEGPRVTEHRCDQCTKIFRYKFQLRKHVKKEHLISQEFVCHKCKKSFYSNWNLKEHIKRRHSINIPKPQPKDVPCPICGRMCRKRYVRRHMRLIHEDRRVNCPICHKSYRDKHTLKFHTDLVHKKKRDFVCTTCGRGLSTKKALADHVKFKHEGFKRAKPFACDKCPKTYENLNKLQYHIERVHLGIRDFGCPEEGCDRSYPTDYALKDHIRLAHRREHGSLCNLCGKELITPTALKNHKLTVHEGIRAYRCDLCGKDFKTQSVLKGHVDQVHLKKKNHVCPACGKGFGQYSILYRHKQSCVLFKQLNASST